MSRWQEDTGWPYWFVAFVRGEWRIGYKSSATSPTVYVTGFGSDRLGALRNMPRIRREYEAGRRFDK